MRYAITLAALAALSLGCGKPAAPPAESTTDVANEAVTLVFNESGAPTVEFDVPGIHCEVMCVPKVRETLQAQPGVVDVKVDLDTKVATVAIEEEAFDSAAAIEALAAADFPESALRETSLELVTPMEPKADGSVIEETEGAAEAAG